MNSKSSSLCESASLLPYVEAPCTDYSLLTADINGAELGKPPINFLTIGVGEGSGIDSTGLPGTTFQGLKSYDDNDKNNKKTNRGHYRIVHHNGWKTFVCLTMWQPKWLHWMRMKPVHKYCRRKHHDGTYSGGYVTGSELMRQGAVNITGTEDEFLGEVPQSFWIQP